MTAYRSCGRLSIRSAVGFSPQEIRVASETLSTCSCTTTGEFWQASHPPLWLLSACLGPLPWQPCLCCADPDPFSRQTLALLSCALGFRFKVFADYEAYIKCQGQVDQLFMVRAASRQREDGGRGHGSGGGS